MATSTRLTYNQTIIIDGIELEIQTCASCGTVFAVAVHMLNEKRRIGGNFYCPNGHPLIFNNTTVKELTERAEKAERLAASRLARLDQEKAAHKVTEHRLSATKGVLTKTKKRIANGVCPCCHRSFVQLERHMSTRHPNYVIEANTID